jgi:hypothetical protein
VEQALEHVRSPLVAHAKPAAAEEPGVRPFHDPSMSPQSLAGVDATASNAWGDAASAQGTPEGRGVIGLVGVELGRTLTWSAWLPPWPDDRRNGIDERKELGRVVGVGRREADGERDAVAIDDEVVLGAELAPVHGVRSRLLAPLFARTLMLSRLARLQSMAA